MVGGRYNAIDGVAQFYHPSKKINSVFKSSRVLDNAVICWKYSFVLAFRPELTILDCKLECYSLTWEMRTII